MQALYHYFLVLASTVLWNARKNFTAVEGISTMLSLLYFAVKRGEKENDYWNFTLETFRLRALHDSLLRLVTFYLNLISYRNHYKRDPWSRWRGWCYLNTGMISNLSINYFKLKLLFSTSIEIKHTWIN